MKTKQFVFKSFIVLTLASFVVLFSSSVLAVDNSDPPVRAGDRDKPTDNGKSKNMSKPGGNPDGSSDSGSNGFSKEGKDKSKNRLDDKKLKVCKEKEKEINTKAENLGRFALNMQEKFDAIATRIKEYHDKTVAEGGKLVPNYDSLVSDIQSKKEAVKAAVEKSRETREGFSCDGEDPKAQMDLFKEDMKAVKAALQAYRTSIKNLIVAVRSVAGLPQEDPSSPKAGAE